MPAQAPLIRGIGRGLHAASQLCVNAAGALILVIVGIAALDMITSFAFNRPIAAATNLSEELLPAAVFLSTGTVIRKRADIVVDVLTELMGRRLKWFSAMLAAVLSFLFFLVLGIGAVRLAVSSVAVRETAVAAGEFAVWPIKIAFAVGVCVSCLEAARIVFLSIYPGVDSAPAVKNEET